MEFAETITITHLICLAGLILLACWLLRTSLGTRALADSVPRRNNMPLYLPFIPLFVWFGSVSLALSITRKLLGNLEGWQSDFRDNIILCIGELTATVVIVLLARVHFARRLKGFGLSVKTIHKDFFAAFVNLLAIWPIIMAVIILTVYFGELIWGDEYQIQQHQQLELIAQYQQLPLQILVVVVAVVVAPLLEEFLFRGLIQTVIRRFFEIQNGAWLAIVISSVVFAIIHADAGHWPTLFVLGLCLGYAYEKSGSLFRPVFIHSLFNATSIIAALYQ
ncbi:MAG: lysostaphin resistance A-like protein [Planctomycetota bacterium]|jgi:membrane protease YdiL (CAAX protease family)